MTALERLRVRDMARWMAAFEPESLAPAVIAQARLLVLDTIGCAIAALAEEEALLICHAVEAMGGAPQATLIGRGVKTSAAGAALANGALLRFLDLNDYLMDSGTKGAAVGGHPSDNIGPLLAVAEWRGASGRDLIGAITACYEIYGRLNGMMDRASGWDTTSVSAFAVAAAAGRLMGLDEAGLVNALALAGTRAATPGVVRSGNITAAKFLANPLITHSAIEAAVMAEHGLTGPVELFEHERGLGALFDLDGHDPDLLSRPLTENCTLMLAGIKAYPCLATGQPETHAAIRLHDRVRGRLDDIARITVTMADSPAIRRQQADPGRLDPRSREAADHSFPFLAAVALIDGRLTPRQFDGERWNDKAVRALMDRLVLETDAALGAENPGGYPCRLRLDMTDGSTIEETVLEAPGISHGGIEPQAVTAKFDAVTGGLIGDEARTEIRDMALALDTLADIAPLMARLGALRVAAH